jgi:hypothetical protein
MKQCDHTFDAAGQQLPTRAKAQPTIEELREYLDYEPETGVLRWKKARGTRAKAGAIAGRVTPRGYLRLKFKQTRVDAHRVAFALHNGHWPTPCCDHINGNPSDNRAANLRECTRSSNQHNRKINRNNTSGVKGVYRMRNSWLAQVSVRRKVHTKCFRHLEDAAAWAKHMREQLHGEFARH